ncbi:TRAP transporter substrate-binding protein [Vallitaleaceae bacterium 9-2]
MKMKKMMAIILTLVMMIGLLAGCQQETNNEVTETETTENDGQTTTEEKNDAEETAVEPELVLRYGDVNPLGHVLLDSADYFAQQVNEMSEGRIKIELYPSGQLGDDNEVYQALQMGAVDLYRGNASSLTDFGNMQVSALALPYIFRDREHFWAVCGGEVGQKILDNVQETGSRMVGLFYMDEGARNFFTTEAPITTIEDIQGLKVRVQNSALMLDTISALGANPTPIDYAELYTSLQTGVVDGAENPPASYYSNKFYEVAPYYVLDGHTFSPSVILMSEITWNNLSEEDQAILVEAGKLTEIYNREAIEAADQAAYENLEAQGVQITTLEDPEKWSQAMDVVYDTHGSEFLDLIEEVRNVK